MNKLNIALGTLLLSLSSFASLECEQVNLYEINNKLNDLPIEFQGDMNTCYAHSLAQNYNITKAQHQEDKISAYWIAFLHKNKNIHWNPKDMDYSMLAWASKDLKKWGKCNFSTLEQSIHAYKFQTPYSHDQFFFLYKKYFNVIKKKNTFNNSEWIRIIEQTYSDLMTKTKNFTYPWKKSEIIKVLSPIRLSSNGKTFFNFLSETIFNDCIKTKKEISYNLDAYGMKFESNKSLAKKTSKYLFDNKPISIGHCPDVTYDEGALKKKNIKTMPRIAKSFSKRCGAHYALIVGSRQSSNNKCEYLVRNSYGKGYWADQTYTCFCENKETKERFDCSKLEFDSNKMNVLGCWIDADRLLTNTYELDVIL